MTRINVTTATTNELVDFYNEHAEKPVKRFSDRKTAERRVSALLEQVLAAAKKPEAAPKKVTTKDPVLAKLAKVEHEQPCPNCGINVEDNGKDVDSEGNEICMACNHVVKHAVDEVRSEAIAKTWLDEEVRAKRSTRHIVKVDGVEYRSVRAAFVALNLPLKEHIKFRMELKVEGDLNAYGRKWVAIEL